MSGQPYKYASDPAKFRAQYMDTLHKQEEVNDYNLQANKTYKETGQLPPMSQMKDTRTTTEILADKEKLKIGLIEDLKGLGTPNFILSIIQGIETSPLNTDGSLFTFFAQRAPELSTILKKQYKYGIKGDKNDTTKFVSFIEDMYSKTKAYSSTVSSYFSKAGIDPKVGTIKLTELDKVKEIYGEIVRQLLLKLEVKGRKSDIMKFVKDIAGKFNIMASFLSKEKDLTYFKTLIESEFSVSPDIDLPTDITDLQDSYLDAYQDYYDLLEKLPRAETLFVMLEQLQRSLENTDLTLTNDILVRLDGLLPNVPDIIRIIEKLDTLAGLYNEPAHRGRVDYQRVISMFERGRYPPEPLEYRPMTTESSTSYDLKENFRRLAPNYYKLKTTDTTSNVRRIDELLTLIEETDDPKNKLRTYKEIEKLLTQDIKRFRNDQDMAMEINGLIQDNEIIMHSYDNKGVTPTEGFFRYPEETKEEEKEDTTMHSIDSLNAQLNLINAQYEKAMEEGKEDEAKGHLSKKITVLKSLIHALGLDLHSSTVSPMAKKAINQLIEGYTTEVHRLESQGIEGSGLKRGRGRPKGRAKGSGVAKPYAQVVRAKADYDQGIQECPRFVKFGRYLVNQKMLGEGIFSIKSVGGYRVPDVPSTRLSKPLQGIITKMIKGGSLTFDELSTLTEPEKVFLHKVSKKSNIIDKFSIPTPSMDRRDKDIHEFEVMKGEIMAGNDSKDLIKKFKTHLIKLSREGTLPKKEVSEIMEILLELGH